MSDRNTGGHHSRTVTLRRLGWLGAVTLLGAALLIPGTAAAAFSSPKCGCSTTSTQTTTSETSDVSETSSTQSTETSDVSETSSTQSTETSDVSETTSTQTTTSETSDVSETTSTQSTQTTTDGTSTTDTETGGVGGETGTPDVTPPSTSSLPGSSGSSDGWRVILLALAGIAVLSLILLPGDRKRTPR